MTSDEVQSGLAAIGNGLQGDSREQEVMAVSGGLLQMQPGRMGPHVRNIPNVPGAVAGTVCAAGMSAFMVLT